MPHRRGKQKGSFGSHFDELVNQFPNSSPEPQPKGREPNEPKPDKRSVHDRLFESAWRKTRDENGRSGHSNLKH